MSGYSKAKAEEAAARPKIKYRKNFPKGQECRKESSYYPEGKRGTRAGYNAHRKAGEAPCQDCRDGANEEARDKYRRQRPWLNVNPDEYALACEVPKKSTPGGRRGTTAGFSNHKLRGEEPCAECLEAERLKGRKHMNANYHKYRDQKLEYQKEYREKNKEKIRAYNRERYYQNKESFRDRKELRVNLLLSLPSDNHTLAAITEAHGTTCYLCLAKVDTEGEPNQEGSPHVDHVHPISDPDCPGDILDNVRWTHAICNLRKGKKMMSELELPFAPPKESLVRYEEVQEVQEKQGEEV